MKINQSSWDVTSNIDWVHFGSGQRLTFVIATYDSLELSDGFRFEIRGLLDEQGKFHVIAHSVVPANHPETK